MNIQAIRTSHIRTILHQHNKIKKNVDWFKVRNLKSNYVSFIIQSIFKNMESLFNGISGVINKTGTHLSNNLFTDNVSYEPRD